MSLCHRREFVNEELASKGENTIHKHFLLEVKQQASESCSIEPVCFLGSLSEFGLHWFLPIPLSVPPPLAAKPRHRRGDFQCPFVQGLDSD